jgi:hypothetical protein
LVCKMNNMHLEIKSFSINSVLWFCMKMKLCRVVPVISSVVLRSVCWIKILNFIWRFWIFYFNFHSVSYPLYLFFINIWIWFL